MVAEKKQWNVGSIHEHTGRITRVVTFSEKLSDEAHRPHGITTTFG